MARRIIKTREDDDGIWDLVAYNDDDPNDMRGFWVKREESWKQEARVPIACPACGKFLYNIDTQYIYKKGVCADCYVTWIEDRDLSHLKSNKDYINYCKDKIEEKKARKAKGP